jgi:hypothetical protein
LLGCSSNNVQTGEFLKQKVEHQEANNSDKSVDRKLDEIINKVHRVYMTTSPNLSDNIFEPLFIERDKEKIIQILKWIEDAKPVEQNNSIPPIKGRGLAVVIELKNHKSIKIAPSWICEKVEDSDGEGTSCTKEQNKVWIYGWNDQEEFVAHSKGLFSKEFLEFMPKSPLYNVPEQVKLDESFSVIGNGWLVNDVKIEITGINQDIIWSNEVAPKYGHFDISINLKEIDLKKEITPGQFFISISSVERGINTPITITE